MIISVSELLTENENLKEENAELKRLLKLAVEDIYEIVSENSCDICTHKHIDNCSGKFIYEINSCFEWKHADEVMKIIGGNENE